MAPNQYLNSDSNYSCKFDIWSLGSIFYELLVGLSPFFAKKVDQFKANMMSGTYDFRQSLQITPEAIHFITQCLQYEESNRASSEDLLYHTYLKSSFSPELRLQQFTETLETSQISQVTKATGTNNLSRVSSNNKLVMGEKQRGKVSEFAFDSEESKVSDLLKPTLHSQMSTDE